MDVFKIMSVKPVNPQHLVDGSTNKKMFKTDTSKFG